MIISGSKKRERLARLTCDISSELAASLVACLIVVVVALVLTSFQILVGAIDIPPGVYAGDVKKKKKEINYV
jgi:hypothetical protein